MNFVATFLAIFLLYGFAQTPRTPIVIKGEGCFSVVFLEFSPDGKELARGCAFGPIEMFDTATYTKARTFRAEIEYTPELTGFAYSPDATTIAISRGRGGAVVWDAADPGTPVRGEGGPLKPFYGVDEVNALEKPLHVLEPPAGPRDQFGDVLSIRYSPDSKRIFTTHHDGRMKIWSTSTWTSQRELVISEKGNSAVFSVVTISPDGQFFVIGDQNGVLHYRSLETNQELRTLRAPGQSGRVTGLHFSPDGKMLIATHQGETFAKSSAVLWNTSHWNPKVFTGYGTAAFSRDGQLLAIGGTDIRIIDSNSREEVRKIELPAVTKGEVPPNSVTHSDAKDSAPCPVTALAFSPDTTILAAGCFRGELHIMKVTR